MQPVERADGEHAAARSQTRPRGIPEDLEHRESIVGESASSVVCTNFLRERRGRSLRAGDRQAAEALHGRRHAGSYTFCKSLIRNPAANSPARNAAPPATTSTA